MDISVELKAFEVVLLQNLDKISPTKPPREVVIKCNTQLFGSCDTNAFTF